MTDRRLPEYIDDWPTDPFELLGIPHDADLKAVRDAYRALIHQYKPERAPEEFRRIRDAYDRILNWRQERLEGFDFPLELTSVRLQAAPETESVFPELDAAWHLALTGDPHQAYLRLTELGVARPEDDAIAARRYWLLRLSPAVDQSLSPIDVLYPLIRKQGLRGLVGQLFLQELDRGPLESLSNRCGALLQDGSNLDRIRPLLQIRWRTAVVARRWELIHADLDQLRRVDPLGNIYWLRGHVDALRASLLVPPSFGKELKETCLDVLNGCEDWSPETERLLGEVEEIERMLAEVNLRYKHWHSVFLHEIGLPKSVWQELSAFRMPCQTDPAILRLLLEPLLTEWANDPVCGLGAVDRLFEYFPLHAVRLADLINGCNSTGWNNLSVLDGDALKRALLIDLYHERRLRRPSVDRHVSEFRRGILRFCVEEQVDLEPVIEVLSQLTPNLPWDCEFHPLRLEADDALRTVIRGCLALWEEPAAVVS